MRSRIFKFGALLAAASVASAMLIAQPGAPLAAPKKGGTLVIGMSQKPRHLNPAVQSGIATAVPGTQIFATPLRFDENWNPQPYLAESWEVADDGLSVTLKLREAKFHDGKPITSEDLAFSLMTVKENHPFKAMFAPVTAVETPDARTAVIKLEHPHPAILLAMSSALMVVIPKHVYGDGQDPKSHPANTQTVGSGAYKLVEFKPSTSSWSAIRTTSWTRGPTSTRSSSATTRTRPAWRSPSTRARSTCSPSSPAPATSRACRRTTTWW